MRVSIGHQVVRRHRLVRMQLNEFRVATSAQKAQSPRFCGLDQLTRDMVVLRNPADAGSQSIDSRHAGYTIGA